MSYNILYRDVEPRGEKVCEIIKQENSDLLGLQEVTPWWEDLLISRFSDVYGFIGQGREEGNKGERSTVCFKKSLFEPVNSKTVWLTDTPDVVSKVEGSRCLRVATLSCLKRKSDGGVFVFVNTHLDHGKEKIRAKQADILCYQIRLFLLQCKLSLTDTTVIITGDFNDFPLRRASLIMKFNGFKNSSKGNRTKTFHGYGKEDEMIIDYIYTRNAVTSGYNVVYTKVEGLIPSDHYPVICEVNK